MENKLKKLKDVNEEFISEFKVLSNSEITEEILKKCGGYGRFQKKCTAFVLVFIMLDALSFLTVVFLREKVPFACYPSHFNESLIPPNITLDEFLDNVTVEEDKCSVYNLDMEEGFYVLPTSNSTKELCNNGRKFYTKDLSSMVSEFDLVCGREWMKNIAVSVMFAGVLVGSSIFGVISDRFGRFKTYFVGEIFYIFCRVVKINSPNYIIFVIMFFFEGLAQSGTYIITYTILVECVSQEYRMPLNFAVHGAFAVGEIILAGVAYLLRDWQHLQYATCLPRVLMLIIALKCLPESPRWLLNKRKFERAEKCFNMIARTNKKDNEDMVNLIRKFQREAESKSKFHGKVMEDINLGNKQKIKKKTYTVIDLLKSPRRAMISTNIWFNWFISSMLYYGVTLNSVDMSGNRFLNFLMFSAVEIPSCILGISFYHWFGHRKPLCFFMVFGGINCLASSFVPKANMWFPLILAILGKLGATASFDGIYLTSAELFPTAVRSSGMGTSSSFARVGALLSPIILGLSMYGSWIPLSVYGVLGVIGGFLILLLPEMKDACLLQTFEDMDNL